MKTALILKTAKTCVRISILKVRSILVFFFRVLLCSSIALSIKGIYFDVIYFQPKSNNVTKFISAFFSIELIFHKFFSIVRTKKITYFHFNMINWIIMILSILIVKETVKNISKPSILKNKQLQHFYIQ